MSENPPADHGPLPRILVVDDSPDSLWLMSQLLEGRYQVLQAASGREALALANAEPSPDLMLLDIVMPDMDGYEVLRRLRQQPRTASIPVAFMTSLTQQEQQVLGRELGAVDYLTKPVDVREVTRRVEAHVRARQHARRLEVLGERLARHLQPDEWRRLFDGDAENAIEFAHIPLCLLLVQAAPLNGSAADREAFLAELAERAAAHGGALDRFERDATALLFEQPADALAAAKALHARHAALGLRLGLHDLQAQVASFHSDRGVERTLVGSEAELARIATEASRSAIAITPSAYAALRQELQACHETLVLGVRWQGGLPGVAQLAPLSPARQA
jgi:adenylate cyclase